MSAVGGATGGVTVVIPAYNESQRLGPTLEQVAAWLESTGRDGEILVVDDGSDDGTAELTRRAAGKSKVAIRLLVNERNLGKGASVKRGVEAAATPLVLFTDADLSTPIEEADKLLAALATGADLVIGSRAAPGSRIEVRQAWYRELMGKAFNVLARLFTGLSLRDTQCGFKAFRVEAARRVFPYVRVTRFGFDVEVLFVALRRGLRVQEVPVLWRNSPNSRVHPVYDSARMFLDLLLIRTRALSGRYDEK